MRARKFLALLLGEERAAALVEFALVAPVFVLFLLGLFDISYNIYAASILEGAIQKAARDSTIEGVDINSTTIDARVSEVVRQVVPNATIEFERLAYTNFADVARPEDFTDTDGNGRCNDGEPFEDVNGNDIWDDDRGRNSAGSARDAVLYSVTVTYRRAFPIAGMIGVPEDTTTVARTVLRNQPYGSQEKTITVGNCV